MNNNITIVIDQLNSNVDNITMECFNWCKEQHYNNDMFIMITPFILSSLSWLAMSGFYQLADNFSFTDEFKVKMFNNLLTFSQILTIGAVINMLRLVSLS